MIRPTLAPLVSALCAGLCVLASTSCDSPTEPDRPDLQPENPLPEPDTVSGSLRGFGLRALPGGRAVTLVAHGSDSTTCETAATGGAVHELPLTPGVMRRLSDTYSAGGRVYLRPITSYGFIGRGALGYSERHRVAVGGRPLGEFHNEADVLDPIDAVVVELTPETEIPPGALQTGDTLRIELAAEGYASLGRQCGGGGAGQVKWRMWGAVLWMET